LGHIISERLNGHAFHASAIFSLRRLSALSVLVVSRRFLEALLRLL
jgi:hypothetical protein